MEEKKIHKMHCVEPWFTKIKNGEKTVEGRKGSEKHCSIAPGDMIEFTNGAEHFIAQVTKIDAFNSIKEYLNGVGIEQALPGVLTVEEGEKIYLQWSTKEQIKQLGFLGIWVEKIHHR